MPHLDSWVGELFTDEHLDDTCAKLAAAAQPDTDQEAQERQIRDRIRKLTHELDSYRAIVRSEPEAASTVGRWIAETNQERRRLEALLGRTPTTRLTSEDVKAVVASLQDITATLAAADPADKAKVYAEMGIDITYHQDGRVVVESRPRVVESSVGERTRTSTGSNTPLGPQPSASTNSATPTRSWASLRLQLFKRNVSTKVLMANSTPTRTVSRSRLRSTTVLPPRFDVDIPPPKTSERPPPLPEWSRTSAITAKERTMCTTIAIAWATAIDLPDGLDPRTTRCRAVQLYQLNAGWPIRPDGQRLRPPPSPPPRHPNTGC